MKNSSKHLPLTCLSILVWLNAHAQITKNFCGTDIPSQAWNNEFQKLMKAKEEAASAHKSQQQVFTIPVIVHVIHGGQPVGTFPNLAQAQINSQIPVLNYDFSGAGYNTNLYPYNAFSAYAISKNLPAANLDANGRVKIADCGVQFCLATKDTLGNILPEPGIDRINYISRGWVSPMTLTTTASFVTYVNGTVKPQSSWNASKYLNIWVSEKNDPTFTVLGFASYPTLSGLSDLASVLLPANVDGIWCSAKAFGSAQAFPAGTYYSPAILGRVCTHEVGHYLGLHHVWGDGNCMATDYCNDTPPASTSNFGSPTYPYNANGCAGNSPDGEMFMNVMDYTNEPVRYMFTTDQSTRVQTAMINSPYRKFLGTHGLCTVTPILTSSFLYDLQPLCTGVAINFTNTSVGFPAPGYTWSATGGFFIPNVNAVSPSITFSSPGSYVITLFANNGTLSSISKTITVTSPPVVLSASSQTICPGNTVILNAFGGNTFTWVPGGIAANSVTFNPMQTQTYFCNAIQVNGCRTNTSISVYVSECTGMNQITIEQQRFNIYPNPAKELLNIAYLQGKQTGVVFEIIDVQGNLISGQTLMFSKEKQNHAVNISSLPRGIYFVKLTTSTGFDTLSGGSSGRSAETPPQFIKLVKE